MWVNNRNPQFYEFFYILFFRRNRKKEESKTEMYLLLVWWMNSIMKIIWRWWWCLMMNWLTAFFRISSASSSSPHCIVKKTMTTIRYFANWAKKDKKKSWTVLMNPDMKHDIRINLHVQQFTIHSHFYEKMMMKWNAFNTEVSFDFINICLQILQWKLSMSIILHSQVKGF